MKPPIGDVAYAEVFAVLHVARTAEVLSRIAKLRTPNVALYLFKWQGCRLNDLCRTTRSITFMGLFDAMQWRRA